MQIDIFNITISYNFKRSEKHCTDRFYRNTNTHTHTHIHTLFGMVYSVDITTDICQLNTPFVPCNSRRLARARAHVTVVDTSYSAACQQRSTLHEQQYSGSSAKSTPNEYDYSMEMRPLPSVPASEKDLSKRQSGTGPADDMLVS